MTISVNMNSKLIAGRAAEPFSELPPSGLKLSRQDLEFVAHGPLSELFGPLFKQQDSYARVCRMPGPPMLLVDRVTGMAGEPGSMQSGIIWTETDVKADDWFLHAGRMPTGICIESGQADLLLISWLGADFLNRSERVYRFLGCELTFHSAYMPKVGDTIRFQIHIDAHAKLGDTRLFFFRYDAHVGDRLLSSVRHGQAGFFSDSELAASSGVLWSAEEDQSKLNARLDPPPMLTKKRTFSTAEIAAFTQGDAFACFGAGFEMAAPHIRTPSTCKGRMRLFDRIVEFDPQGGPWRRGYMRAEADVRTDAWFYPVHFHNDPCMPGTLMVEAATQVLEFYMAALGFTIDRDGWVFSPATDEAYKFICRGQVIPDHARIITYEVFIEEIIGGDRPTIYAALLATTDGRKAFLARRFGVCLMPDWPFYEQYGSTEAISPKQIVSPIGDVPGDYGSLLASSTGKSDDCFGSQYRHLDNGARVARVPCPPYQFMSRIVSVNCPPGVPTPEGTAVVDYDVPANAWYFQDSGNRKMPFAVLMEAVLQPCGWFAFYMGFTKANLAFRNLDGSQARILQEVTPQTGTLSTSVSFKRYSNAGSMTIIFFTLVCRAKSGVVMTLETSFGYFAADALANQKGLPVTPERRAQLNTPSGISEPMDAASSFRHAGRAQLPSGQLDFVDAVTGFWPQGGRAGLGSIRGRQIINPGAWYFKAHFFQDPVQPGSIGLEGLITLAKTAALLLGLDTGFSNPRFEAPATDCAFSWKFRGQVLPTNREVTSEIEICEIIRDKNAVTLRVEGSLWVDGVRIYELQDLALRLCPGVEASEALTNSRERLIDLAAEPWFTGHCPNHRTPVFPMFGVVGALYTAANSQSGLDKLVSLNNLEVSRWMRLDNGPVRLQFKPLRKEGDREWIDIWFESNEGQGLEVRRIGRVIETYAEGYPKPPAPWSGPKDSTPVNDPYAEGLFHTQGFAAAENLRRDRASSIYEVDVEAALKAASGDLTILLDLVVHGIPHYEMDFWFDGVPRGCGNIPYRLEKCEFFADMPRVGRLQVVSKAIDLPTLRTPRCAVQVQYEGRVILEYVIVTALVPVPGQDVPPKHWRDFLLYDRVVPGGHVALLEPGRTEFSIARLKAVNWFPGTLEQLYRVSGDQAALVEAVTLKDHFGRHFGIHPANVELDGEVVRADGKALKLADRVRRRWISNDIFEVTDI